MSAYHTYVGPYVRCAITMVDVKRLQLSCPNTNCHNRGLHINSNMFCPLCGSQIASITVNDRDSSVDQWDVSERIQERLSSASGDAYSDWSEANLAHLWLPNVRIPDQRDGHLESRCDFFQTPISVVQVANERSTFERFFAKELAELGTAYGSDAVTVEWGIIQDYN